jgi:hypothetical protein
MHVGCAWLPLLSELLQYWNERFNKGADVIVSSDLSICVKRGCLVILLTDGQAISKE